MVLGIGALTAMDALAKTLVQQGVNPMQILGLRIFLIAPAIFAYYWYNDQLSDLVPVRLKFQILRACIGFGAPFCFFFSLKYLPLSDATISSYSSIMLITVLSHFVLREKVGVHRWGAVVVGFFGVYIATSPSGDGEILGYALVFIAALAYAVLMITGRILSRTDSVGSMVITYNLCVGLIGLCFAPFVWHELTVSMWITIMGIGALALTGHLCVTVAFTRSQTSVIAPFEYTSLIWAIVIEFALWHYLPEQRTVLGALLIICAGLYVLYRENLQKRN